MNMQVVAGDVLTLTETWWTPAPDCLLTVAWADKTITKAQREFSIHPASPAAF